LDTNNPWNTKFFTIFLIIFCCIKLFPQENITDEFENRRNKFIDEGFGFNYVDEELTNYELFLLRHNNPIHISEYDLGTELLDKKIILDYNSIIVIFRTCEYGTIYGTEYKALLWDIESKDNTNYLYGIRHGMTIGELEKITGKLEIEYNGEIPGVTLKSEKKHSVYIEFSEGKIAEIIWYIDWWNEE
jgi:hypothetical protein